MKAANEAYLASVPELRVLLDDFVTAVLKNKPADISKYAGEFFAQYTPAEEDKGVVPPDTGLGVVTANTRRS